MYYIEDEAKRRVVSEAIAADSRTFRARIVTEQAAISPGSIGGITIEHTSTDDDVLRIGEVISRRAQVSMDSGQSLRKGDVFRLYLYLLGDPGEAQTTHDMLRKGRLQHSALRMMTHRQIAAMGEALDPDGAPLAGVLLPFGEYEVTRCRITDVLAELTAYDKLIRAGQLYTPGIPFPASSEEVLADIAAQLGIAGREQRAEGALLASGPEPAGAPVLDSDGEEVLVSGEYFFMIPEAPVGRSCREVLGWIGTMYGGNVLLDREGLLVTAAVDFTKVSGALRSDRISAPELADANVRIGQLRCMAGETELVYPAQGADGLTLELECPYMTPERLRELGRRLVGHSWRPGSIYEQLADPCRDLWDNCRLDTRKASYTIPVTSLIFHFDGGLSADIEACGDRENE